MDPLERHRALRACKTCRDRKKGCDKSWPKCGYCKARRLGCKYDSPVSPDPVKWQQWSPSKTRSGNAQSIADRQTPATTASEEATPAAERRDLSESLWTRVQRVVASLDLSPDDIADQFFAGTHTWLPILSPPRFRHTLHSFRDTTPPADFSALLLSMCLSTFRHPKESSPTPSPGLTSLYLTTRSVFIQAQAVVCASTAIIQTAVLLAVYEYARGRVEAAYIQVGFASRMCHVLGIDRASSSDPLQSDHGALEELNVWWSVIILERQILLETPNRVHYPMTKLPTGDCYTPVQFDHDQTKDATFACRLVPILPGSPTSRVGGFGRLAQAVYLLDKAFSILNQVSEQDRRIAALSLLDKELQHLLTITMGEYQGPGSHCGANATVLRTLFLLHQSVLCPSDPAPYATCEAETASDQVASSEAALNTVARMMAQVATDHVRRIKNVDRLPVCAYYNFQLCLDHIEARQASLDDDVLAAEHDLKTLVDAFKQRWQVRDLPHAGRSSSERTPAGTAITGDN